MKFFEVHRNSIRVVALVIRTLYILTIVARVKFTISSDFCIIMILLTAIFTILQIITCLRNIASESNSDGSNSTLQGLLLWLVIFVATLGVF